TYLSQELRCLVFKKRISKKLITTEVLQVKKMKDLIQLSIVLVVINLFIKTRKMLLIQNSLFKRAARNGLILLEKVLTMYVLIKLKKKLLLAQIRIHQKMA